MDVRDGPWRPPRERLSEGRGRGKVPWRAGEKPGRALALPALPALASPLAERSRDAPDTDKIAP